MRTKFKVSILSMLAIVFTFAFVLVGCGESKTRGETISLTEAKTLIVSALATDDNPDNRSIFAKFGKTQLLSEYNDEITSISGVSGSINAQYEYSNGALQKFSLDLFSSYYGTNTIIKEYSPEIDTIYLYTSDGIHEPSIGNLTLIDPEPGNEASIINGNLSYSMIYLQMYGSLFTDDAFTNAYNNVTKTNTSSGYDIALSVNFEWFIKTILRAIYTEEQFIKVWEEIYKPQLDAMGDLINSPGTSSQVVLEFNNNNQISNLKLVNNISGQTASPSDPSASFSSSETMTISPYTGEITEPQWVTDYLAEQSQAQE